MRTTISLDDDIVQDLLDSTGKDNPAAAVKAFIESRLKRERMLRALQECKLPPGTRRKYLEYSENKGADDENED